MKQRSFDHISDLELLERYQRDGNQEWIGILLERYTLLLLGVCMKYLKDEHEAQDSVQQIFLKVLTDVTKYRIEFFKSWLYMVAKNHCLMRLREKGQREIRELKEFEAPELPSTENLLQDEKLYDHLEEALKELNREQRECVILFYLGKNSYQQIADKTGYSLLQVKSYIQNGKRNLRLIIEKKAGQKQQK